MMPSYCSNCGEEVPDDAKKCLICGAEFEGEEIAEKRPEVKTESAKTQEIQKKPRFERLRFRIFSATVFISFGIFCVAVCAVQLADEIANRSILHDFFVTLFGVLISFGIIYMIIGIFFATPGKMREGIGLWSTILIVLPALVIVKDILEKDLAFFNISIHLIWLAFAITGLAIIIVRWKTPNIGKTKN